LATESSLHEIHAQKGILRDDLRLRIIESFEQQGFNVKSNLTPNGTEKDFLRRIHEQKKIEQLTFHREFLLKNLKLVRKYSENIDAIEPTKIDLELREVKPESDESRLFFWWNLAWWSLPFDKPIGRQMRFILWDKAHDAPFGLIGLQSPPLRSTVRDRFLELSGSDSEYWINQSMYAQRVGALPPYNDLLGGKMVALSLASNEIRNAYALKYRNSETLIRKRKIPNNLLFITTSSAFGKSSMYDRISYGGETVCRFIGFTSGAGTFHIPELLYRELLRFLKQNNADTKLGYGTGSSRKLRLISKAFRILKIPSFSFHNIRRGYYLFSNVQNLHDVVHNNKDPCWHDRPFRILFCHWLSRWGYPRSIRIDRWKSFDCDSYFEDIKAKLEALPCSSPGS
jgi:hypothetical protein